LRRLIAALRAGNMEVEGDIDNERQVAIQLAHNAITGKDDPNILWELYQALSVVAQRYSGLTDESFSELEDLNLDQLKIGLPKYQEFTVAFLPEDAEVFEQVFEQFKKLSQKHTVLWSRLRDYETFFAALVEVQEAKVIANQAVALSLMAELAMERLIEMEPEPDQAANG
jgi:hypothetical protein